MTDRVPDPSAPVAASPPTAPAEPVFQAPAPADPATADPAVDRADPAAGASTAVPAGSDAASRVADLVAGPGGVMTDEAGVVTGELTLRTVLTDGRVSLQVQYKDAEEWYAVTGAQAALADPSDLDAVHAVALALLNRPEG